MSTFVTVTTLSDEEPPTQIIEFADKDAAEKFVSKVNGLYNGRTDASIEAEIVTPEVITEDSIDSWIGDNLNGFSKGGPQGVGAQRA